MAYVNVIVMPSMRSILIVFLFQSCGVVLAAYKEPVPDFSENIRRWWDS
jgi:hypothetical protein